MKRIIKFIFNPHYSNFDLFAVFIALLLVINRHPHVLVAFGLLIATMIFSTYIEEHILK